MTPREREALATLCRRREKLAKAAAVSRAATLKAEFERQIAAHYRFDDDDVWKRATEAAEAVVQAAQRQIAERSQELGIPPEFAPSLGLGWRGRGQNALNERRTELRRVAHTRIDAMVKQAHHAIEEASVRVQTNLLAGGLESEDARAFLESMPTPEQLMPTIDMEEIEARMPARRLS